MSRSEPIFPPLPWQPEPESDRLPLLKLMREQSLTAALKATGAVFSVQVLHQGAAGALWAEERVPADAAAFYSREVYLLLDGRPVVWARSVCADGAAGWKSVLDCGTQPLGAQLFGGGIRSERSGFLFARVPPERLPQGAAAEVVWARRSQFVCGGEALGLIECFLPGLSVYFA